MEAANADPVPCDAPPYPIVTGCRLIGLTRPEDVRWCRTQVPSESQVRKLLQFVTGTRKRQAPPGSGGEIACPCGHPLVCIHKYQFTFDTGHQACYRLGQCKRCLTIFWNDA